MKPRLQITLHTLRLAHRRIRFRISGGIMTQDSGKKNITFTHSSSFVYCLLLKSTSLKLFLPLLLLFPLMSS